MKTPSQLAVELSKNFRALDADSQEVLVVLSRRLLKGAETYGKMDVSGDGRDYLVELGEELADTVVYHAMEFLKRQRATAATDTKNEKCPVCNMHGCKWHWENK